MNSKILKYLILVAFLLFIVAISSFWFSGPSFREKDVVFEIDGPNQVTSGDEVVYKLKYSNETRSTLHNMEVVFFYPEGSIVLADGKMLEDHNEDFTIESLGSGEKGEKEFKAYIIGEKGSIKVAKATMSFKSGSLSSVFEKSVTSSTTIINAPITLTLVAPPSMSSGVDIQYLLDYRNTSDEDASDLILEFDYPDGFIPRNFNPQPNQSNNSWHIDSLKKGSGGRITISGMLNGKEGESKVISVKLKRKISGDYVDYQKATAATEISNPVLGLSLQVNNASDYSASLGDRLNYIVKYSNDSNVNFFGMNMVIKFEGDMYDFATLDTRGGFFDDSNKTITWNTSVISDFGAFSPGLKGQISFSIALKPSFPSLLGGSGDKFVKMTAKFGTQNIPTGFEGPEVAVSESIITKISTQPTLNQSVYYNDPSLGSMGPLPMRVGEETAFTVHWQTGNPGNDIDNIQVITKLPAGVQWDNMTRTNNNLPVPTFNQNTNEVIWSFPKLPYGTGIFTDKYEASFRIKYKPTLQQKGSKIQLLDGVQLKGTDSFTRQEVILNRNGLTSDGLADRPREGTVQ